MQILVKSRSLQRRAPRGGIEQFKGGQYITSELQEREKTAAKSSLAPLISDFSDDLQFHREVYEQQVVLARANVPGVKVIPLSTVEARIKTKIRDFYARAFLLGKRASGNLFGVTEADTKILAKLRLDEYTFLRNFLDDIRNGKGRLSYQERMEWYASAARELYWHGFLYGNTDENRRVRWGVGPTEHCASCLSMEGEYKVRDLIKKVEETGFIPQSGRLDCRGFHCQCKLEDISA